MNSPKNQWKRKRIFLHDAKNAVSKYTFSEQQEEEDKREEFWTELHYGRGGRTALMGSKLEVELDCPGGPNKVYWGRRREATNPKLGIHAAY